MHFCSFISNMTFLLKRLIVSPALLIVIVRNRNSVASSLVHFVRKLRARWIVSSSCYSFQIKRTKSQRDTCKYLAAFTDTLIEQYSGKNLQSCSLVSILIKFALKLFNFFLLFSVKVINFKRLPRSEKGNVCFVIYWIKTLTVRHSFM
jgi:hypothetical protein